MPILPPGHPGSGSPGGGGGGFNPFKRPDSGRNFSDDQQHKIQTLSKEARIIREHIDLLEEEVKKNASNSARVKELTDRIDKLNTVYDKTIDNLDKLLQQRVKEETLLGRLATGYSRISDGLSRVGTVISDSLSSFHAYNLEIQRNIELSGRSVGASDQAHKTFQSLRRELNLSRQEASRFAEVWSSGLRLGATNQQLTQLTRNLRAVYGAQAGTEMAARVVQTPMTRTTLQGVAAGDTAAIVRAIRTATTDQAQAIAGTVRAPGGRPQVTQDAARFQAAQARLDRMVDDIKLGIQAATNAGIGPEMGALLGPVGNINDNVARLVQSSTGLRSWLPGIFNVATGRLGISVGGSIAGVMGRFMGRLGIAGVATAAVGYGAGMIADRMAPGSTGQRVVRGVGGLAQVGGMALTGAALAGPVGAIIGGLAGVGMVWGRDIARAVRGAIGMGGGGAGGAPGVGAGAERVDFGAVSLRMNVAMTTFNAQLERLTTEVGAIPANLEAQISQSRLQTAIESIDPTRMFMSAEIASQSFAQSLGFAQRVWTDQTRALREAMAGVEEQFRAGAITEAQRNELIAGYNADLRNTINTSLRNIIQASNLRGVAQAGLQRFETRTGQIGLEREAARTAFQRGGAITGNVDEINNLQSQLNEGYTQSLRLSEQASRITEQNLQAELRRLDAMSQNMALDSSIRDAARAERDVTENQLLQTRRTLAARRESLRFEQMNAEVEMIRERATAVERDVLFRRSQRNQELLRAQEGLLKERGAAPGEVGALARGQSAQATRMLDRFMENFDTNMRDMEQRMDEARRGGDNARAILIEQEIFNLANRRVELERSALEARMNAASAEERFAQEQIGAQRRVLEIQRDAAGRVGASWRVQMGFQAQIIRMSQADLQSTRRELNQMAQMIRAAGGDPMRNIAFLNRLGEVTQKQADLQEAILGKQRSFLEQATAASFGMGGGSRVLPALNPRIFGEQIQNNLGMRQAGVPLTMRQQRLMLQQAGGPQVFGMIPGAMGLPARPVGGLPGQLPAEMPPGGGMPPGAAPGLPGPGANAAQPAGPVPPTDVSGRIEIVVSSDNAAFNAQIRRQTIMLNRPGMG
jgi:hypothetical protein